MNTFIPFWGTFPGSAPLHTQQVQQPSSLVWEEAEVDPPVPAALSGCAFRATGDNLIITCDVGRAVVVDGGGTGMTQEQQTTRNRHHGFVCRPSRREQEAAAML